MNELREGRDGTTLAGPRRCPWCGHRTTRHDSGAMRDTGACRYCRDLPRIIREHYGPPPLRDELRQAVKR